MDAKFVRIDSEDDPDRCQASGAKAQCPFKAIPGSTYCPRHKTGNKSRDPLKNYHINQQFLPRMKQLSESEDVKNLREEIALLRMVVETIVNRCEDEFDLSVESDRISKLVGQLQKLVESCHKIEQSSGELMGKTVILNIGGMMVNILSKYVADPSVLDKVGEEIGHAIEASIGGATPKRLVAAEYNDSIKVGRDL